MTEGVNGAVFRFLYVDPDLHLELKAEAKATGRGTARLFCDYVRAGLMAEFDGLRPRRPVPDGQVRLVSVSLYVPRDVDEEFDQRVWRNGVRKSVLYRAYLRLGMEARRADFRSPVPERDAAIKWRE